ncbi:ATP-binding protein [Streptomyces sp. S3(2020)]|uniref:ATP-binding protein n=1 Tax=Streptomyces sp. S3(2020) TaxID=2732044 RepID=UPI0014879737|nr:ATP-binding protein [Streptomyces sp. S3(2020)]NNN31293.1 ATP-binding protein [Streptomyces sp. S3(2020)]
MDARRVRHERVVEELDAFAHWFAVPDPSSDGHFLTLTLFAEYRDTARVARDMTAVFLERSGMSQIVDDARLVVSELVGNVVNHVVPEPCLAQPGGSRRIDVILKLWPKWLFIGIKDEDSTPPLLPMGETFPPGLLGQLSEAILPDSGRGLLIVQRLAAATWWTPEDKGGKTVWCRLDLDEGVDDSPS